MKAVTSIADRGIGGGRGREIVLALNSGSSSLKFGVYDVSHASLSCLVKGNAEALDQEGGGIFDQIRQALADANAPRPTAIAHRFVHGGPHLLQHRRIDASVIRQLESAAAFAPVHMPASLRLLDLARDRYPSVTQVACFDTAFHARMPLVARMLPLPRTLRLEGIRRYGFHGLSCESIVRQLADRRPERLIVAHLGNGSSVTAVRNGQSVDTSMGLTPSGGVIMGSRCGDLDPGVLLYLLQEMGMTPDALEALVNHQSGLLGISGLSGDMRRLHGAAPTNPDARLAVDMFCSSVRKQIAAMISTLGGVDVIVFTGGIGENDSIVRDLVCDGLRWAGLTSATQPAGTERVRVDVLESREEEQMAVATRNLLYDEIGEPGLSIH